MCAFAAFKALSRKADTCPTVYETEVVAISERTCGLFSVQMCEARASFEVPQVRVAKLRIHSVISKAALIFGSEAWMLKKLDEQRLEAAQMKL
jgi:hypothetical protein